MNIYFISYFLVCIVALFYPFFSPQMRWIPYSISLGIPTFLICFRDMSIGNDACVYFDMFLRLQDTTWEDFIYDDSLYFYKWESGYLFFQKLLGNLFVEIDGDFYIFMMGIICLLPMFLYIKKYSVDPILSLLIFFAMDFGGASYIYRGWMALMISLSSHSCIIRRDIKRFLFFIFFASLFHRTVLVLLPLYFLYDVQPSKTNIFLSILIAAFIGVTGDYWFAFFSLFARNPLGQEWQGGIGMLMFLWIGLISVYFMARRHLENPRFRLWFMMLWIAAITQPLCFSFSLWSRVHMFFLCSLWTLLPEAIYYYSQIGDNKRFIIGMRMAFMLLLFDLIYIVHKDKTFLMGQW